MSTWPATLPQQFIGMEEVDDDSVLRTPMDSGPPTRRNRFTSFTRSVSVPLVLSGTQKQTFDAFYRTTLANGSLAFDWEDPTTDATVSFAFKGSVRWTLIRGGTTETRVWSGTMQLEIQPTCI